MRNVNHVFAQSIPCWVELSLITDGKKDGLTPGKIIGITLYPGHSPTFIVELEGGYLWYYIPPTHCFATSNVASRPQLADVTYHNCPAEEFEIHALPYDRVAVYLKTCNFWCDGKYLFTIDWWTGNDLLNLIALDCGWFCFMPNHKTNVAGEHKLDSSFRKIKQKFVLQ